VASTLAAKQSVVEGGRGFSSLVIFNMPGICARVAATSDKLMNGPVQ
jgi:hypothetical protein